MSFNKSENIEKIAIALSKFQGEVKDAVKDQIGYGYKYANLESILAIVRPLCTKYELAITQLCSADEKTVAVNTVLMHSSGQWIGSEFRMSLKSAKTGNDIQTAGSIITYIRRYSLSAILGTTTQSDNDGAHDKVEESNPVVSKPYVKVSNSPPLKPAVPSEESMQQMLFRILKDKDISSNIVNQWLENYQVKKISELTDVQVNDFLFKYVKGYKNEGN